MIVFWFDLVISAGTGSVGMRQDKNNKDEKLIFLPKPSNNKKETEKSW